MLTDSDKLYDQICAALTAPGGRLEVVQESIRGQMLPVFKVAPPSLRDYFFLLGAGHGDLPFIVYGEERLSFNEALVLARRYGAAFQARYRIAKGDRVALAMRNYPEWCLAFMGLVTIGAIVVPLNAWWTGEELAFAIQDSGARLVVADGPRAERVAGAMGAAVPVVVARSRDAVADHQLATHGWDRLEDVLDAAPAEPFTLPPLYPEDDATILYTSGSTGNPKGVVSTHRAVIAALFGLALYGLAMNLMDEREGRPYGHQSATLLAVPLFHTTGCFAVWMTCFIVGRKLVMMHKWDAGAALRLIEAEKVTHLVGVPTMTLEVMEHPDRDKYDISSLRDMGAGGAARPTEHVRRLKETFPQKRPTIGYGLTETNAFSTVGNREGYVAKPASAGRPIPFVTQMKIAVDDSGAEAACGEVGEIWWRTAALARGYWMNPEATNAAFTPDGWFKSGDLGYFDEDGYLFIVDRKKDIIIRGGENVSCLEVEAALHGCPDVLDACVFGLPDKRLGEIVGAVVYARPEAGLTAEKLLEHAAKSLAAFKVPAYLWLIGNPLPRLGSGKIDKAKLRRYYLELFKAEHAAA
ncbi:class I adenylate-forming enzyme family protein [Pedomonas mirosovicensis]|uniref:class I adenylate-forming enzyme family protein n=1 Tax=Pedomonas mirosovicensis TaxID=2908641 RepID=UPI002167CC46|nr:class I adenylate-forming enzyme family protein [Pedomonas mirosovicensis]MCH8685966.1 acyl--CoA ligase [Pedomonas mirosovicensis]